MLPELLREFEARFGRSPTVAARAPGRVNLIGEHTDYNGGWVLPCAIDRTTLVLAAPAEGSRVRVFSRERGDGVFDAEKLERRGDWLDYVQGIAFALDCRQGLDLAVASQVPTDAGLSSSAALGVALATAVDGALALGLSAEQRARVAHRGESEFVGVACGIMDPFASALGQRGHALRIDCRSEETTAVPLPDALCLLVVHSGVTRSLADGAYNQRREECFRALAQARAAGLAPPDASSLRDVEPVDWSALERALEPVAFRRARHVIRENERVERTCAALASGDLAVAGAQLCEGMRSLRDDFQVSTPELDALCALGDEQPGVYGSRLSGAGFGGCTLHLAAPDAASAASRAIADGFEQRFGRRPPVWEVTPAEGAGLRLLS